MYWVRLLEAPEQTAGGIFLPEEARTQPLDAEVLAAGDGELLHSGARYPMQAQTGDRCVFEKCDFIPLEGQEGFIADSRLVAVIPGPEQDCVLPAGDYVFILPERKESIHESEGGVLVAAHSLAGQDATAKRRGDELHAEFVKLESTQAWKDAPTEYYRHRICWDFLDHLSAWEREALGAAIKRGGRASHWKAYIPRTLGEPVRTGEVHALGPGRVNREGFRDRGDEAALYRSPASAQVWMGLMPGDRIHLDREYHAVSICDGSRNLLAVKARFLAAVTVEDDDACA